MNLFVILNSFLLIFQLDISQCDTEAIPWIGKNFANSSLNT